jgi:gliding motility-associated-like protein
MKAFYFRFLIFFALILRGGLAWGQVPANDNCDAPTNIPTPKDFCGNFTSVGATASGYNVGSTCPITGTNDVWFSFLAVATTVTININGQSTSTPNFSLRNAQAILYYGECGGIINELGCGVANNTSSGTLDITKSGLIVGEKYFIRVFGANTNTGTFKLCVKNYNQPASIDSDCPTGTVLCDKSPFSIQYFTGFGKIPNEFDDAPCLGGAGTSNESNSVWLKWTAEKTGTLTFNITPNFLGDGLPTGANGAIGDDIDFAVYELPNGLNNCGGKKLIGCMASGPYVEPGCSIKDALRCAGATGAREGSTTSNQDGSCPCNIAKDNFLKPFVIEAGKSYALGINNFSGTSNGFSIDFGGTGTFVGPEAKIKVNKPDKRYCLGEDVIFDDASTFAAGRITNRSWRFGKDASRDTANGIGPFRVFYKTPGWKSVVLTVTTERGCIVTNILDSIYVKPFEYDSLLRRPTCNGGRDGVIRLRVTNCGRAPIRYNWENTGYTTVDSISGLAPGSYRVAVTDSSGVYIDTFRFNLKEFVIELDKTKSTQDPPKCNGQTNGRIVVSPSTGVPPFRYRWNNNTFFTLDSTLSGLGNGQYTVEIRDANNCAGFYAFDIQEPPPLSITVDAFNISCFGRIDGYAVAYPSGGVGKYSISWSNGAVGDTVFNLKKGVYVANLVDSNGCFNGTAFTITEPPQIGLTPLSIVATKCYGDSTGSLVIRGTGGTPPFRYSIDGIRFQKDTLFKNIPGKKYNVVVRDSTGCRETIEVEVPKPPQLEVNAGPDLTIELGLSTDLRAIVVPSSKLVSYKWTPSDSTLSCFDCPRPSARPLRTTLYTVSVKDSAGCTALDDVELKVLKIRPIFIPNIFSPNGDGVNDYFAVFGNQAAFLVKELRVYDRWGGQVFEGQNIPLNAENLGWNGTLDGKQLNPDVFAFYALIRFIDGEEVLYKGSVTLVR